MAVRQSAPERLQDKYGGVTVTTELGSQLRFTVPAGVIVATWVVKKDRLSYSSGFLFGTDGSMRKLSAREVDAELAAG